MGLDGIGLKGRERGEMEWDGIGWDGVGHDGVG